MPLFPIIKDSGLTDIEKLPHIGWSLFNPQRRKTNQATCEEGTAIPAYSGETEVIGEGCTPTACQDWKRTCLGIRFCAPSLSEAQLLLLSNHNTHLDAGGTFSKVIVYPEFMSFL